MNDVLTTRLSEVSMDHGPDLFGIADADDFSGYTDKRSPFFYLDTARSVIDIGHHMNDPMLDVSAKPVGPKRAYLFVNEIVGNIALGMIPALLEQGKQAVLIPHSTAVFLLIGGD